jgi:ketosteroid isomerase-like protein
MSEDTTRQVMDDYLHALLDGSDYSRYFAPDVVWTTMETGEEVRGREAVRDLIHSLHREAFEAKPELVSLVTGDGIAILEAVFDATHADTFAGVPRTGAHVRLPYCMAYTVSGEAITALRAYFPIAALTARLIEAGRPVDAPA